MQLSNLSVFFPIEFFAISISAYKYAIFIFLLLIDYSLPSITYSPHHSEVGINALRQALQSQRGNVAENRSKEGPTKS